MHYNIFPLCKIFPRCLIWLTDCVHGLLSTGCRAAVPLVSVVCCLVGEIGLGVCYRLPGGRDWYLHSGLWIWALSFLWAKGCQGVCLGCLWAECNFRQFVCRWVGCVPILIVVWLEVFQHWSFQAVQWSWVFRLRWRLLGELMLINIPWGWQFSGSPMARTQCSLHGSSGLTLTQGTKSPQRK